MSPGSKGQRGLKMNCGRRPGSGGHEGQRDRAPEGPSASSLRAHCSLQESKNLRKDTREMIHRTGIDPQT